MFLSKFRAELTSLKNELRPFRRSRTRSQGIGIGLFCQSLKSLAVVFVLTSCATGRPFVSAGPPASDASRIYIYREETWFTNANGSWNLLANGRPLAIFSGIPCVYTTYLTGDGSITFTAAATIGQEVASYAALTALGGAVGAGAAANSLGDRPLLSKFHPNKGQTYYFRWENNALTGERKLVEVEEAEALPELRSCHSAELVGQ